MTTTTPPGVGQRTAHDPGDPLVTSHCPFCGSGQVVGRSDGTIGCDFCGQNYIVRVQPAFPGMPQMPMGPGAPSDVGPDGGLMDPGMVGPDGMPPDEGMPPGDPGEDPEAGGDGGFPPGGGDEEAPPDDEEDAPPPKKSKKASRRYLGAEGQVLTEDQLLRHVAVRVSGADPRVLARMRQASAAAGRSEQDKASRGHYQRGWKAGERGAYAATSTVSPMERADSRGEPGAWYQGYHDYAADRPKFHSLECPGTGDHYGEDGCTLE